MLKKKRELQYKLKNRKILTIPNIITFFRICLIPVILKLYCIDRDYVGAAIAIAASGLTDVVDGIIAREFNMVSDLGKALDPVADKLTQLAVMVCLVSRFHLMIIPVAIIAVKELVTGVMSLAAVKKSGKVEGAVWHGKLNTVILYAVMVLHVIWIGIPSAVSCVLIVLSSCMMIFSAVMYFRRNMKALGKDKK
ncbi:MAG: CDP-alcohol phosphatidyltransferase family protein [Oscillospiraceae bacterium]|nr:CDP-alcohol phosphatidyltransferase family protein [Oscillospiraceae bacterium]